MTSIRMPVLFVGHGSPMNALEQNQHTQAWRRLGDTVPVPTGILAISAHWYTEGTRIASSAQPQTIHDFRGFPPELFAVRYGAPGAPHLVPQVQEVLKPASVAPDGQWGLDHGVWSVLVHMYPHAQIPVTQLSIDATQPAQYHYDLGRKLGELRGRGVLILASGNVVHDLRSIRWGSDVAAYSWAQSFNDDLRNALSAGNHRFAIDYAHGSEAARQSIPTPEHYLPLLYVLGASRPEDRISFPTDGIELGSISMLSVLYS